jgi:GT2 family glycosyltransferase
MQERAPKVYIIILNWNGWRDTIECLESVFRLKYDAFTVLVCDNASSDGSLRYIASWANGETLAECANPNLQILSTPPVRKPIPFLCIEPGEYISLRDRSERLFLVQTGANLGFAGGNNAGMRLALDADDFDYVWLLNNDTVVDPDALISLIKKMDQRPGAGICGSMLLDYYNPETVQALGGSAYNRWTARSGHIGRGLIRSQIPPCEWVEGRMKYVVGASMFVRKEFLEQIGLMCEDYFLYFEEIDWVTRATGQFALGYSQESVVYHKEGAAIGTAKLPLKRSALSEFYATRNRILFTRKYFRYAIGLTVGAILLSTVHRFLQRNRTNCFALFRGLLSGFGCGRRNLILH